MTPPTTDTSREAVELACEHVETHERNLNNGFPMTCEIGSDIQSLISVCRAVVEERDTLVAERDALRDQLAAARNEVLEEAKAECEAQRVKCNDNGQFEAAAFCKNLLVYIDALKSTTPAPREVTVQEAARVLLGEAERRKPFAEDRLDDAITSEHDFDTFCSILRALANEGKSDE
jgi:regulator of replication initiation timing